LLGFPSADQLLPQRQRQKEDKEGKNKMMSKKEKLLQDAQRAASEGLPSTQEDEAAQMVDLTQDEDEEEAEKELSPRGNDDNNDDVGQMKKVVSLSSKMPNKRKSTPPMRFAEGAAGAHDDDGSKRPPKKTRRVGESETRHTRIRISKGSLWTKEEDAFLAKKFKERCKTWSGEPTPCRMEFWGVHGVSQRDVQKTYCPWQELSQRTLGAITQRVHHNIEKFMTYVPKNAADVSKRTTAEEATADADLSLRKAGLTVSKKEQISSYREKSRRLSEIAPRSMLPLENVQAQHRVASLPSAKKQAEPVSPNGVLTSSELNGASGKCVNFRPPAMNTADKVSPDNNLNHSTANDTRSTSWTYPTLSTLRRRPNANLVIGSARARGIAASAVGVKTKNDVAQLAHAAAVSPKFVPTTDGVTMKEYSADVAEAVPDEYNSRPLSSTEEQAFRAEVRRLNEEVRAGYSEMRLLRGEIASLRDVFASLVGNHSNFTQSLQDAAKGETCARVRPYWK